MGKKKNYKNLKDLEAVEALKVEVEEALGDDSKTLEDSRIAKALAKEKKMDMKQIAGLGTAGAVGVAGLAYYGAALPLIISTSLVTGIIAWPVVLAGGAVVAAGSAAKIIHSKTKKSKEEQLVDAKNHYLAEIMTLQDRMDKQIKLETQATQSRREYLNWLSCLLEGTKRELASDLGLAGY